MSDNPQGAAWFCPASTLHASGLQPPSNRSVLLSFQDQKSHSSLSHWKFCVVQHLHVPLLNPLFICSLVVLLDEEQSLCEDCRPIKEVVEWGLDNVRKRRKIYPYKCFRSWCFINISWNWNISCWGHETVGSDWYTWRRCCHWAERWAGELGREKLNKIQHRGNLLQVTLPWQSSLPILRILWFCDSKEHSHFKHSVTLTHQFCPRDPLPLGPWNRWNREKRMCTLTGWD